MWCVADSGSGDVCAPKHVTNILSYAGQIFMGYELEGNLAEIL